MRSKGRWIIGTMLLLASWALSANEVETVIVTATRTAQTVDETLAPVTVITREEIERRQAKTIVDVLQTVPGVALTNNGGLGQVTSLFLRGTNSGHVTVLVDGIPAGSATLGTTPFENLPLAQVDRIEVVRGPRSSLYGANAIGGVIQIFTRADASSKETSLNAGFGSKGYRNVSAGFVSAPEHGVSVRFSHLSTDGFDSCSGATSGCYVDEPDRDGHARSALSFALGRRLSDHAKLDVNLLYSDADTDYDGSFSNQTDTLISSLGGRLTLDPSERWRSLLSVGQSTDGAEDFKDGVFSSRFKTRRTFMSWQNDTMISTSGLITTGIDYQDDQVESDTEYDVGSRDNKGLFAQYQRESQKYAVQGGLRYDDNTQFGGHTTGSITVGFDSAADRRFTLFYGTAFKSPTFNDLYYPGWGNPSLDPEESDTVDLGYRAKFSSGRFSLNLFQTNVEKLIAYDPQSSAPANIDEANIKGLEVGMLVTNDLWQWSGALTLLDTEQLSGRNKSRELPRRPSEMLSFDVTRNLGRYSAGVAVRINGKAYDDLSNSTLLDRYAVMDVTGSWKISDQWRLDGKVENLFDKDYATAAGYRQPGLGIFASIGYRTSP